MDIIFGFGAALLSGLGIGSGGILVIYLTLLGSYDQITAQGINLLFFLFSSGSAMLYHINHRKINGAVVLTLVIFGLMGAAAGNLLLSVLGGETARKFFGAMLVLSGIFSLKGSEKSSKNRN